MEWRDLDTIEFRMVGVHDDLPVVWIRWDQTTNALALRDPKTGEYTQSGQPGSKEKLKVGSVELDLRHTTVVGSGPLGPSVMLSLALKLKPRKLHGLNGPLNYFDEVGELRIP